MGPKGRRKPDTAAQLDDPTEFHAPSLRALDHSLRCSLCQELFTAPVLLTACSHSFDSLCVREHLAETKRCPICHVEANEDRIKPVHQLEEAVRLWKTARADILALQAATTSHQSPSVGVSSSSSSPTPVAGPSRFTTSSAFAVSSKPMLSSDRKGKRKALDPTSLNGEVKVKREIEELTLADSDDDDVVIQGDSPPRKRTKSSKGKEGMKTPKREDGETAEGGDPEDPNLVVSCPICAALVKNAYIALHVDSGCTKGKIKPETLAAERRGDKSAFSRIMSLSGLRGERRKGTPSSESEVDNELDTTQPLSLKSYTGKTVKDLTKMLTDYHLPVTISSSFPASATLPTYISRHQHFTRIWNANADIPRASPAHKTPRELRDELYRWESEKEGARREEERRGKERGKGPSETETKQQWLDLIAQARQSALQMREQQRAAGAAKSQDDQPAPLQPDADMTDADGASSTTLAPDEPPQPAATAAEKSPSPVPPPPLAAARKRSVRILSPVRSSPPLPDPPNADVDDEESAGPPSSSLERSPPSFLQTDDTLGDEDDDFRSLLAEKAEWERQEKEKKRARRDRGREERKESPFNPEPPRPSQRNKEEERMFAELAARREAATNGDEEDQEN
ncbi:hypothetical protein JCM11251_006389 [Rhodosporidiobolus azoricus]